MRKFIINNYFGEGTIGKYSFSKGAPLNFLQVGITAIVVEFLGLPQFITIPFLIISIAWLLYVGMDFMGKGYFSTFPVTWDELNDKQRWYWGRYYDSAPSFIKKPESLKENWSKWIKLDSKFKK